PEAFTEDLTVILETDLGPATVIAHSYGGLRTLRACADRQDLLQHAIILDSRVRFLDVDSGQNISTPSPRSGSTQLH
ncbi:alpha/beta hydrolase, partial [Pantoea sp. SIMBA_072]